MKPAPLSYLMTVGGAILLAAIIICRDLDVPILWSTAIGVALWSWVLLLLWSAPLAGENSKRRSGKRPPLRRAACKSQR